MAIPRRVTGWAGPSTRAGVAEQPSRHLLSEIAPGPALCCPHAVFGDAVSISASPASSGEAWRSTACSRRGTLSGTIAAAWPPRWITPYRLASPDAEEGGSAPTLPMPDPHHDVPPPAQNPATTLVLLRCRICPFLDQGGAAARRRWLGVSAALRLRRPARRTPSHSRETPADQHSSLVTQARCVLLAVLPPASPGLQQPDATSVHTIPLTTQGSAPGPAPRSKSLAACPDNGEARPQRHNKGRAA
jgi:hypothetical protein